MPFANTEVSVPTYLLVSIFASSQLLRKHQAHLSKTFFVENDEYMNFMY